MKHDDYKEGWGVVEADGLNIKTVSDTRRAAIVNWLVVSARQFISNSHTDAHIDALWDAGRGDAMVMPVRIYVQP